MQEVKSRFSLYFIVFCIAWGTLALELLQTRVLSALFFNNVVYLTVTIALMGFGISGVFVSIFSRHFSRPEAVASVCIGCFALSSFVCLRIASLAPILLPNNNTLVS